MTAPEVDSVVSPANFTQVGSPQAGDFVILLRDQSFNPKMRLIGVASVGGALDFLDDGSLVSTRTELNIEGGGYVLTDDAGNTRANLQLGTALLENAVSVPVRAHMNLIPPNLGSGFVLTDDAGNDRVDVQLFGNPYIASTSTVGTLPSAIGADAIVIGPSTVGNGARAICIGDDAGCDVASVDAIAIGPESDCTGSISAVAIGDNALVDSANGAIQLGAGTNNNTDTIQYQSVTFANDVSIEVMGNVGSPDGVVTARQNTLLVNTATGTDLFINTDGGTTWELISGTGGGGGGGGGYAQDIGDNVATSIAVAHGLGTEDVVVSVWDKTAPFREVDVDVDHTDANTITLGFVVAPTLNQYRVFITAGGGGGAAYTAASSSSGVDVTLTPGASDHRQFISPTVATINCIILTAGATNETFWTIVNDDPGTGDIDVKIDLVGNPTQVTLDAAAPVINVAYDGSDYKFYA